ncbi:tetratricopeptide repeat protein [Micromonospora sp. PLK6-60]|uniref:tetratricopeptide repeat protein n=1 Tax=Micromonospora sp. PLK6-60 TaxID=2873383 RepID=UPI001CA6356D|nr:tetratricopeptide repeat protein [Micromonospora sp. PLK6-60]MBY8871612.1 tetratricopeptide repeat protein [Micromonospora sp. PLK6-60]
MNPPDGPSSRPTQIVTATAGFAYGVIGADIHVFGDGVPLYLLENWRGVPPADPRWLREAPSRMLNARLAVVPFTGRSDELAELLRWREDGPRLAVRWLHGAGGQGKTRLAAEFADRSAGHGWRVVTATHGPGTVLPPPGSQDLSTDDRPGLLLVVDYADRWPLSHLTWLLSNAMLHRSELPTRVLLLARTADAWPTVRATVANHRAATSQQQLAPLPEDRSSRVEMFDAARDSFASVYGTDPDPIRPPGSLDHPDLGLTLAVHMAALVAVDAHATGRRAPPDLAGLTLYLLDREHLHWAARWQDGADRTFRTRPPLMNRMVFTAALAGPTARPVATQLLAGLGWDPEPERIVADHAVCYPPEQAGRDMVLEPLYPDRLAEDFLALTLPGHAADYPAQEWAGPVTPDLLDRLGAGDRPTAQVVRAVTFLAAGAARWPHVGRAHLHPLLRRRPRLAVEAGNAALILLAEAEEADLDLLERIEELFPDGRDVELDPAMAAVARRLTRHRLARTVDPGTQVELREQLAARLSAAGLREEALAVTEQAVAVCRDRIRADDTTSRSSLAVLLNALAGRLAELGRLPEAVTAATESVRLRRGLAAGDPGRTAEGLANSLSTLGALLVRSGRPDEALAPIGEAVGILGRLDPDAPLAPRGLADATYHLGAALSALGRREEALAATTESVRLRRRLVEAEPGAFLPDYATSLNNLAAQLMKLGRHAEAASAIEELVRIRRRLAESNPAAHEPGLGNALHNLGRVHSALRRRTDALDATTAAVRIRRRLAAAEPAAFEPDLASSLNNLAAHLMIVGRTDEALGAAEECVRIRRRLSRGDPAAFEVALASGLSNLDVAFDRAGRPAEAERASSEALAAWRRVAARNPGAHLPDLAVALSNHSTHLVARGRRRKALAFLRESVEIRRRVVATNPAVYGPGLALALMNLGLVAAEAGRRAEALASSAEAVERYRALDEAGRDSPEAAQAVRSFAMVRSILRVELPAALAAADEAVHRYAHLSRLQTGLDEEYDLAREVRDGLRAMSGR